MVIASAVGASLAWGDAGDPPAVADIAIDSVTSDTATISTSLSANQADTTWNIEYGTTTAYGAAQAGPDVAGTSTDPTHEVLQLTGLDASTVYHFRVEATNGAGTTSSDDGTFTTTGPPVNTVPPALYGLAAVGRQLSMSIGTWSNPGTVALQWQTCDGSGANCTDLAGANDGSFTLDETALGTRVRARVTETTSAGTTDAYSEPSSVVTELQAPVNVDAPSANGIAAEGSQLWASSGAWDDAYASLSPQWKSCDSAGDNCSTIDGATDWSYTATALDTGNTLRVSVTATNDAGSTTVDSSATDPVAPVEAAVNTSPPTISGTPAMGETLSADPGQWTPYAYAFTWQWQRCDVDGANCADIEGATGSDYGVGYADAGSTIRVRATAVNLQYTTDAVSDQTEVVASAPPENVAGPTIGGGILLGDLLSAAPGVWRYADSYAYQWQRCDAAGQSCIDIPGATDAAYALDISDLGSRLAVAVTATGSGGSGEATAVMAHAVVSQLVGYEANVFESGPLSYWRLDEQSGDTAANSIPGAPDGQYAPDNTRGALSLVGDGDGSVILNNEPIMAAPPNTLLNAPFTVEAWVKPDSASQDTLPVLSTPDFYGGEGGFALSLRGSDSGSQRLEATLGTTDRTLVTFAGPFAFAAGDSIHVVAVVSANDARIYADGTLVATQSVSDVANLWDGTASSPRWIVLGFSLPTFSMFGGGMDEVAVYGRALSGAEIAAHFAAADLSLRNLTLPDISGTPVEGATLQADPVRGQRRPLPHTSGNAARLPVATASTSAMRPRRRTSRHSTTLVRQSGFPSRPPTTEAPRWLSAIQRVPSILRRLLLTVNRPRSMGRSPRRHGHRPSGHMVERIDIRVSVGALRRGRRRLHQHQR